MIKSISVLAILLIASGKTFACSTCMVGDPTLSLMGAEKPFAGRIRTSLDWLTRSEEIGRKNFNRKTIDEHRLTFNLAYAPNSRWMFGVSLPYVERELENFNLADQSVSAFGDVSFSVKTFWQAQEIPQRHMYGMLGGIKIGSASEEKDDRDIALDFDVQAGQGAEVINLGFWYANFNYPYLIYSSASYHVANEGFQKFEAGDALTYNSTLQYAASQKLAWQLGVEGRSSETDYFDSVKDLDSGGNLLYLTLGFVYTLKNDLLLNAVIKHPAIDDLDGDHEETAIFSVGITYDFQHH